MHMYITLVGFSYQLQHILIVYDVKTTDSTSSFGKTESSQPTSTSGHATTPRERSRSLDSKECYNVNICV